MTDLNPTRVGMLAAVSGSLLFYTSLGLFVLGGAATSPAPLIELVSANPGLYGTAYLLQASAFLLWTLVPIALWVRYHREWPGWSLLVGVSGVLFAFWRSLVDFLKAGSVEYVGHLYSSGDELGRRFAEQLNTWVQFYAIGGIWESAANLLLYGVWVAAVGLMLWTAGRRRLAVVLIGMGILDTVLRGGVGFFLAPLYLPLLAFHAHMGVGAAPDSRADR